MNNDSLVLETVYKLQQSFVQYIINEYEITENYQQQISYKTIWDNFNIDNTHKLPPYYIFSVHIRELGIKERLICDKLYLLGLQNKKISPQEPAQNSIIYLADSLTQLFNLFTVLSIGIYFTYRFLSINNLYNIKW